MNKIVSQYVQHMKNISARQIEALNYIFEFIHSQKFTQSAPIDKTSADAQYQARASTKEKAVTLLQRAIRYRSRVAHAEFYVNHFFSKYGRESYLELLNQQNTSATDKEIDTLAKIMFGKTIANIQQINAQNTGSRIKHDDFPARQHKIWRGEKYHRDDKIGGDLIDNIVQYYEPHADKIPLNFIGGNRNYFVYFPTIMVDNVSIEDLIQNHFTDEEKKVIKHLHKGKHASIGLLVLYTPISYGDEVICNLITTKLRSSGLLPSAWEIARFNAKYAKNCNENYSRADHVFDTHILKNMPSTLNELKKNELLIDLAKIAVSHSPTKLLASCLHRMLLALPETHAPREMIQRISLFLSFGVYYYPNNYERFSFIVYVISHEISLLINDALNKGIKITDYDQFKQAVHKNAITSFGLCNDDLINSQMIAIPAMSGTHAFLVAQNIAKKMVLTHNNELTAQVIGPNYYEFDKFIIPFHKQSEVNQVADFYYISAGPIITNKGGLTPGTDINKLVKNKIFSNSAALPNNLVTIIVDVTSALHRNLKLDEDTKKLIQQGFLSIICHESYQKFGLAHTDQVQAGVVYGICSTMSSHTKRALSQFEMNAKNDFGKHLDIVFASYLQQHCGAYLEKIKEQHFRNGSLYQNFFKTPRLFKDSEQMIQRVNIHDEMLSNLDELYFFVTKILDTNGSCMLSEKIRLSNNYEECAFHHANTKFCSFRDSFGHFTTSFATIPSGFSRISPHASDEFDTVINIISLCLLGKFKSVELFDLLSSILSCRAEIHQLLGNEEALFIAGLLAAILNLMRCYGDDVNSEEKNVFLFLRGIIFLLSSISDSFSGRNVYHHLYDTYKNRYSIFSKFNVPKFPGEEALNDMIILKKSFHAVYETTISSVFNETYSLFYKRCRRNYLLEHKHEHPDLQLEYDKCYGLTC